MDLKEQKYVCTLAECQNLTRAAEKLFISQPALSIYINNLEKIMGVELFERVGKKVIPTYAGERYVEKAREMLRLEKEFNGELMDIIREKAGRIRLGVALRRGPWLLPPVVAKYEKLWPGIQIILREGNLGDLNEMLKNFELDIVIINLSDKAEGMKYCPLYQEEFLLAVPPRHPLNEKAVYVAGGKYRKIRPEDLNGQELLLHNPWQSSRKLEDGMIKKYQLKPAGVRVVRNSETMVQMVAEGLGVGFAREGYAVNFRYSRPVNYYMLDMENHRREVVAAYKEKGKLPEYMESMLELLVEQGRKVLNLDQD